MFGSQKKKKVSGKKVEGKKIEGKKVNGNWCDFIVVWYKRKCKKRKLKSKREKRSIFFFF
jgi:hypothetical protein